MSTGRSTRCLIQRLLPSGGGVRAVINQVTQLAEYTMEKSMLVIDAHESVRLEWVIAMGEGSYQHSRAVWHIGAGRHLQPSTHPDVPASTSKEVIDAIVVQLYPSK